MIMKMKRFNRKWLLVLASFILAISAVIGLASPALAVATTAVVTVTGTPSFIGLVIAPTTYTINSDTGGNSTMLINTTYYSNPLGGTTSPSTTVVDGECDFAITNTSSILIDLTGNMSDGSGGSNPMTNVNGATPGAASYAAYAYYSGETFASKVLLKSTGSALKNFCATGGLAANTNLKVGFQLATETGAWAGGVGSTYTLTITGTAH